jgi:predicted nucleic acid-binding protein
MNELTDTNNETIDTNVLVYAHDKDAGIKRERAKQLIYDLSENDRLVFVTQVLNEFYAAVTRPRRANPLPHEEAAQIVRDIVAAYTILPFTSAGTIRALNAIPVHGLSFWNSLIWAAAKEYNITTIYSEDFQHGRNIEGVRFINPFL